MLSEKERAMLGDREVQEAMTARGELLPCWRCGGQAEIEELHTGGKPIYAAVCKNHYCGAYGCAHATESEAAGYWNTRATLLTPTQMSVLVIARDPITFEEDSQ